MKRPPKLTLWQKLDRFSPMTCRLLARRPNGSGRPVAMSDADICGAAKLTLAQVKRISWSESWGEIPVGEMQAFMSACGVDVGSRQCVRRLGHYMRRGFAFDYLRKHPDWKLTFEPLMKRWVETN